MSKALFALSFGLLVGACAQQPSPEQVAEKQTYDAKNQELIAAECKLYKGTGVTPPECKK